MTKTEKLVVFGKGGIGKSTVCANLAVVYARRGLRVLLVGCDPKHDTTIYLTRGKHIPTVLASPHFQGGTPSRASLVFPGALGIDCVEAGGPEPGVGCAGRGITRMSELLKAAGVVDDAKYDVIIYDVLGDVVCGGFATPLREGFAEKVAIVTSEELMALYAANNIARAIKNNAGRGNALVGIIANVRDPDADLGVIERFAARIGTGVIQVIPRDPLVREAEYRKMTVAEMAPDAAISRVYDQLAGKLAAARADPTHVPTPMSDEEFHELSRRRFEGTVATTAVAAPVAAPPASPLAPVAEPWRKFLVAPHDPKPPRWLEEEALNASAAATRLQTVLAEAGFAPPTRFHRSVNLIGLPDGRAAEECARLLAQVGVIVNSRLIPRFDAEEARRFLAAERVVVHQRPLLEAAYARALDAVDVPEVRLPLPYGLRLSRAWLVGVSASCRGRARGEAIWTRWWKANHAAWRDGVAAAKGLRVAFVVREEDGEVMLAPVVRELGFAVDLVRHGEHFSTPDELDRVLREGAFQAVYSDFPLDARISRAGKAQIGAALFEVGPDGALRTQARLASACRRRVLAVAG